MKSYQKTAFPIVLVLLVLAGCAAERQAISPADEQEIRQVLRTWKEGMTAPDPAKALSAYSAHFQDKDSGTGLAAIRQRLEYRSARPAAASRWRGFSISVEQAVLSVEGEQVVARPILFDHEGFVIKRVKEALVLEKEGGEWKIVASWVEASEPGELRIEGLGQSAVEGLEAWAGVTLDWVYQTLQAHPPNSGDAAARREALMVLDDPMHVRSAPQLQAVASFYQKMISKALAEISQEVVTEGMTIWHMYNHGFVVKTQNHTFGFDLYGGVDNTRLTPAQMDKLVDAVDVLFVSHRHGDHVDPGIILRMLERNKPVLAAIDVGVDERVRHLKAPASGTVAGLKYTIWPGTQEPDTPNNVHIVEADGLVVMHTGDQYHRPDFAWIDHVKEKHEVDVFLPQCWTMDMPRFAQGVNPRLIITGHENELGHMPYGRRGFVETYQNLLRTPYPSVMMAWGERYHYSKSASPTRSPTSR